MLEKEELKRYNRQMILPEFGVAGQERLKAARVLIVGAGGLGCPVLQYLVAAGAGTICIVDFDIVDVSNLHRQILYTMADVGKPKAVIAMQKMGQLNPFVKLKACQERLTPQNASKLIGMYDLIIDGSDNFTTRYLVNDTCVELNKPLVFGSIFKFEGHVSVFNYKHGPNYRDVFPDMPPENEVPNCAEIGVIGVLPGIVGTYMANEAIKIICEMGEILSGKLLTINALDNSMGIFKIPTQKQTVQEATLVKEDQALSDADQEITMDVLNTWLSKNPAEVYLIDVRENYEFDDYNIGGTNIPLYELKEQADKLPEDKKLVFICQTGQRSKMAVQIMKTLFKGRAYSVKNGII